MSIKHESYKTNRGRVFEIYGIDKDDSQYNCHHIVTREDFRKELFLENSEVNGLSNLYPIRRCLHKQLNIIITASDLGEDITKLLFQFHQTEKFLQQEEKPLESKRSNLTTLNLEVYPLLNAGN